METHYNNIIYNNKKIEVLQYTSESNTQFNKRLLFIKKMEQENISSKEAIRLSKIWYCIYYKKCEYDYDNILIKSNLNI